MSKYGGSEKTTQALCFDSLNSSRGARRCPPPLTEDKSSPPLLPRLSGLFQAWSDVGWRLWEGQSSLDVTGLFSPHWPSTGIHRLLPPLVAPTNRALCALWPPVSCTRIACSFMVRTGSPAPPPFSAFLQPTRGTEYGGKCLNNMKARWLQHALTEARLLVANKDVAVVDFSSNGAYWTQSLLL